MEKTYKKNSYLFLLLTLVLFFLSTILITLDELFWAYSSAYLAISLMPKAFRGRADDVADPFEPYFGLTILFYLYSISTIQYVEMNQSTYYNESVNYSALIKFAIACLMGQFGMVIGVLLSSNSYDKSYRKISQIEDPGIVMLLKPALFIAILMIPFYYEKFNFLNVVSYAEVAFSTRVDRMQDEAAGIKDVILKDPYTLIVLCVCTYYMFRKQSIFIRILSALTFLAYLLTSMLSGWRGQLIFALLLPVIYYHYKVRAISILYIITGGVAIYVLVNALSIMRAAPNADLETMVTVLHDNMVDSGMLFLQLSSSGELATSTNLLRLIMGIENGETDYYMGGQLISQIGAFVPRALWQGRPPLASELFVQIFYPGVYESGGGYGLFFHQEGYWDFGFFGVTLYALILTWIIRKLYFNLILKNGSSIGVFLYAVLYGQLVLSVVRSGFLSSVKASILSSLPLLILILATKLHFISRRSII